MPEVSKVIRSILKDKDRRIISGTEAVLDILVDLREQVIDELGRAALGSWDAYHLKGMLSSIEEKIDWFKKEAGSETGKNVDAAWKLGGDLIDAPLKTAGLYTGFNISDSVLIALREFSFHKIEGLAASAWDKILGELSLGILGGKTPQQVANAIGKSLKDPGIFKSIAARAEVITKTEMGRTFSAASEIRMEEAVKHVDGLEKQWVHAGHPAMPRASHLAADGQHVPVNEPFVIGGVPMMYPRDPAAPIEETINCGCDHVPYHERWV